MPLDPNRWTRSTQDAFATALASAREEHHPEVTPAHLLDAMLARPGEILVEVLAALDERPLPLRSRAAEVLARQPRVHGGADPGPDRALLAVLDDADAARLELGDDYLATEHLLVALARGPATGPRPLVDVDRAAVLDAVREVEGRRRVTSREPEATHRALERYGTDLTERARAGHLDPVIGRDDEIRRVIEVLSRRTKNNPVLIGEPGVGKTAVVEGLAQRIAEGDAPAGMLGARVVSLDLAAMLAGARFRGEFEERLQGVLAEIVDSDGEVITFIDELHTVVGIGSSAESALDAGNMLKPLLARGQLRLVGATTLDEYRRHIEADAALERRFQPVVVDEPSVEEAVAILRGLKERYEVHHGVRIQDAALLSAAALADRYLPDRFLPDKAIDLVDEAASRLRIQIDSVPVEIDVVQRRIRQLEVEAVALRREDDAASATRLQELEARVAADGATLAELRAQWDAERAAIERIRAVKSSIEELHGAVEREVDLAVAAEIRFGRLPELDRELVDATQRLADLQTDGALLTEEVTGDDIAAVVARWTGVPVARVREDEAARLVQLEEILHRRVVGQPEAVDAVARALRRSRAGLADGDRPIGSFLFLGPTGVGKTELARAVADVLFDDERAMVRVDMSEFMEQHAVARLIGAPPGYLGHDDGGQLTEAVRRRPYSVVLLDEIEKAHADVVNVLLQVLDDGRLTDGRGRTVDFTNVVLVMTSNLPGDPGEFFRPELINRIDDIVRFHPLGLDHLLPIVALQLDRVRRRLATRDITLAVSDAAEHRLAELGHDPAFGARPLKRVVQREVTDAIASALLAGAVVDGCVVDVDVDERGRLTVVGRQLAAVDREDATGVSR